MMLCRCRCRVLLVKFRVDVHSTSVLITGFLESWVGEIDGGFNQGHELKVKGRPHKNGAFLAKSGGCFFFTSELAIKGAAYVLHAGDQLEVVSDVQAQVFG
ncbi:hypothetical protein BHE74_00016637 [Ensete ventricosum]|nr:hypothetical protein BHE74_00016637 [Ensete ventricosum]